MSEREKPGEAMLFVVYWLHFFGCPMTSDGLRLLWENCKDSDRLQTVSSRLPIQEMQAAGYVTVLKDGTIALNRDTLSLDVVVESWTASESGGWAISADFLDGRWSQKAFKLPRHQLKCFNRSEIECLCVRHVLYRWGRKAERAYCLNASFQYGGNGKVGDDARLYTEVSRALKKYTLEIPDRHAGPEGFADVDVMPEGMTKELADSYRNLPRNPVGNLELPYFSQIANAESTLLRGAGAGLADETEAELVAQLAADDFLAGLQTGWAVDRLNALRLRTALSPHATALLQALAFWRNDFKTIEALDRESPYCVGHRRRVTTALKLARDGMFAEAERELSSALGIMYYSVTDQWHRIDFPILLILLVLKVCCGGGNLQGLKRLVRVMSDTVDRFELNLKDSLLTDMEWCARFASVVSGVEIYVTKKVPKPVRLAFVYLQVLAASHGCRTLPVDVPAVLKLAKRAMANGYSVMAADIVSVLPRLEKEFVSQTVAESDLASIGASADAAFAAPREISRSWERALDVLEKALPSAGASKGTGRKRGGQGADQLCWVLEIVTDYREQPFVGHAYPVVRRRMRDGTLGEPSGVSGKSFLEGVYDGLMSPQDRRVKMSLVSAGCVSADIYGEKMRAPVEALRLMAGCENLFCFASQYFYASQRFGRGTKLTPLALVFEQAKLALSYRPDGAVELALPISVQELSAPFGYILDRTKKSGSECWHVKEITQDYQKVVKAFAGIVNDNRFVVPAEGAARVEAICGAAAADAPIEWRQATFRRADDVARQGTTSSPSARLVFADGALVATVCVKLCEEPLWTAEPAKGAPERLVVRKDGSRVIMVRDFAAEESAVAPIRETLARFDTAKTDENHWYFSGLVESLDALAVLHAAARDGRFALEWPDGKSLKLSQLVSHETRVEGGETADYWLGMSGEFKLDDGKMLSFVELLRAFDVREGAYVRLNDSRYLKLSAALARRLEVLKGAGIEQGGRLLISPAAVPALEKIARETEADDVLPLPEVVKARIDTIRAAFAKHVEQPAALRCQMRPYQAEGFEWLSRLCACGIGACLADDMGLGKTVQLIALMASEQAKGASLVVAPASVAFNWRDEIARFAPTLRVALVGQTPGDAEVDVAAVAKTSDVVVTSYGVLTSREDRFAAVRWNVLVLDEAQAIKNHQTKRAQSVKRLQARFRAVATGTPIENRLTELWSIFDFLNPGMLGGETRFNRELAPHGESSPRLKRLVKPLILRRLKRDVLSDLPEKEEITVNVVLGEEERHAYEATRLNALARLQDGGKENKIAILAELTRLRRFCCHPSLVLPSLLVSAKLEALSHLLEELRANNHRALVFSQFVDYLAIVRKLLEERGWSYKYLDGATPKGEREKGVAAFQAGEGDFYLISLKAGGMGLTLTAANYVILLDPWWNPAVENQAADRVHRIGQRLPVTVYRLIAQDTIEEKVVKLHAKKTALADDILSTGASALSAEAMLALLEN